MKPLLKFLGILITSANVNLWPYVRPKRKEDYVYVMSVMSMFSLKVQ